jgi:phosphoglycerol transferase MdoB-like AlkP superfamily enzyme
MKTVFSFGKPIVRFCLFWLLIFTLQRLIFIITHYKEIPDSVGIINSCMAFIYSLRLDMATIAFLVAPYIILKSIYNIFEKRWLSFLLKAVVYLEIVLISAIHSGEVISYFEWGHKLTSRVFMHLSMPGEVLRTADAPSILYFLLLLIIELSLGFYLLRKAKLFINIPQEPAKSRWVFIAHSVLSIFIGLSLSLVMARGGLQQIPINIDSAYFSEHQIMNDISVNSAYFFGNSYVLFNKSDAADHLPKLNPGEAEKITKDLYSFDCAHQNNFISSPKPNVVLIILEGWSANVMGSIHPGKTATPYFDELAKEGVLFTNIFATNTTSEIGNTSIFAGYPSIPETAISLYPEKHRNLPTINEKLKKHGYSTQYLFSGDLKYGNIKGFLMEHGFDKLKDENDFPSGLKKGKLNYYDKDLYALLLAEIKTAKQPFLQCAFTGSTHSPYDHPRASKPTFSGEESNYLNSMIYADKCLAQFISKSKKCEWYKNTVFVIVSDHGHATPGINSPFETAFFNIPLLIFGDPISQAYRGKKIEKVGSQADLAATLLHQLGLSSEEFIFSNDLMSPTAKEFAFFSTIRGYGFITPFGSLRYNFDSKSILTKDLIDQNAFSIAKKESEACFYQFFEHFQNLDSN